jgi:hypothetical protein
MEQFLGGGGHFIGKKVIFDKKTKSARDEEDN